MGALHAGHIALVRLAAKHAERVVVTIFVNPTQFAPHEDFDRYPRVLGQDAVELSGAKVDLVYAPSVEEIYPEGVKQDVVPEGGPASGLESNARPHFFGGVATVVTRLFDHVRPDVAIFGEKDWQQLQVIKTFVAPKFDIPIIPGPTVREEDGLALSSRNRYLSLEDRKKAPALHRVLTESAVLISRGAPVSAVMTSAKHEIEKAGFTVDYVEARHAETLAPATDGHHGPIRLLVAARIGGTRLIDNVAVPHGED
ncbi:pantothenate synthetase 2 [Terrihabitans soli]|uniref:Pantothenate synthetase n=2 Tax=Terrihabitans soli TaxID=708113 RepID=A0A6S6QL75_9HYPH|nr:pantothenate synthetase 2 [Terrihabitans soli]